MHFSYPKSCITKKFKSDHNLSLLSSLHWSNQNHLWRFWRQQLPAYWLPGLCHSGKCCADATGKRYFSENIICQHRKTLKFSVVATSDDPDVRIKFSLSGSENFYINEQTGEIFLISNDGQASLTSASETFT